MRRGPSFPTVDPLSDYSVAARVFEEGVLAHDMKSGGGVSMLEKGEGRGEEACLGNQSERCSRGVRGLM